MSIMKEITRFSIAIFLIVLMLAPGVSAWPPTTWTPGDEVKITGHSFSEEYWTNSSIPISISEGNASFTASYVNLSGAEVMLLAFNRLEKNNINATLPYQLLCIHYVTPKGNDVFIGSVFAFLLAYNDTYGNNGIPDPGHENVYYVFPVGLGNNNTPLEEQPTVEPIPVQKTLDGHYKFGMRYRHLYAKIIGANSWTEFLLSLLAPVYVAQFSELTIMYDVWLDTSTGKLHVESYYTLGQIQHIWVLGHEQDLSNFPSTFGVAAVHYVGVFASKYNMTYSSTGGIISPTQNTPLNDNITIRVGKSERAFDIGLGRSYQLINETSSTTVATYQAKNLLVAARPVDLALISWQAPLSLGLLATFAYSLSGYLQSHYSGPADVLTHGVDSFKGATLWYGVAFSDWRGLKIYQDPAYVAYTNLSEASAPRSGLLGIIVLGGVVLLAVVVLLKKRH